MQHRALLPCLLLAASFAVAADKKLEPLPVEFLEYLSDLEGEEDDWTLVADDASGKDEKTAPTPAKPAAAKPPSTEAARRSTEDKP